MFFKKSVFGRTNGRTDGRTLPLPLALVLMVDFLYWYAMENTTAQPQPVVSLKDTMGTMGRDPQISENDILIALT